MTWQLGSMLLLGLALLGGFLWYERQRPPARVLALVAALAALAVVGRLAFAAFPNVKPTTDIVLFAGYTLGAIPGFAVGAVTALVSNVFLSQGPWTLWQMAGWGGVGAAAALLARFARGREPNRIWLAVACGVAGFAFGAWMDVYQWTLAARQDLDSYLAVAASSLPYNLAHAIGNVLFCLLIGPAFVRALRRYRERLEVRWQPRRVTAAAAMLLALAIVAGASAPSAQAASASSKAAAYLLRAQNRNGGFPAAPGQASSPLVTGWTALGLASARHNPRDVHRAHGRALSRYIAKSSGSIADIGAIERTILVWRAAGLSPRNFGGRDLLARVKAKRRGDGSISGYVSYTAFGVLALRASGQKGDAAQVSYLRKAQNSDGGFGISTASASDPDMTGAVLQALAVAGAASGSVKSRAVAFLRARQRSDGGFGALAGSSSNAQSTAYAVQGLVAARAGSDIVRRAIAYLKGLQRSNGSVRYSRTSGQTPVWVTAQALMALRRKPLPIATAPRRKRSAAAVAGAGAGKAAAAAKAHRAKAKKSASKRHPGGGAAVASQLQTRRPDGSAGAPVAAGDRQKKLAAGSADKGLSVWVVVGAVALALGAVLLARRRLPGLRSSGLFRTIR